MNNNMPAPNVTWDKLIVTKSFIVYLKVKIK